MTYNPEIYNDQRPNVGVTIVPFIYDEQVIKTLVYKRPIDAEQFANTHALPNCFYDRKKFKTTDEAAKHALLVKTNISIPYMEQLHTFSGDHIDPNRINTINITYFALLRKSDILNISEKNFVSEWMDVDKLLKKDNFAFNHHEVLSLAWNRICSKAEYTPIATQLLDEKFTIVEFKALTELLMNTKLNNSRFRDRVEKSELLIPCSGEFENRKTRPAQLYTVNPHIKDFFYPRSMTKAT
jgi:Uncharacterized conserved protein